MTTNLMHAHVTENGRPRPGMLPAGDATAAAAVREYASDLIAEKRFQGYQAGETVVAAEGTRVVTWRDDYSHGEVLIGATACNLDHGLDAGPGEILKGVQVEVFPFAADEHGIWHLPGLMPLQTGLIPARVTVREAANGLLVNAGVGGDVALTHGTSDRDEGRYAVQTHAAVITCPEPLVHHGKAIPVPWELFDEIEQPPSHGPTEAPAEIALIDVLLHSLRHLAYLQATDSDDRAAMPPLMARHLSLLRPELFRRYERGEIPAAA